jgi:uncharacterized protein
VRSVPTRPTSDVLSAREATRIALAAQGLRGPKLRGGPADVLELLRAVQIDTISVLARSPELVVQARLGATARARIDAAFWSGTGDTFEYWSHAACVMPIELWPLFGTSRRTRAARGYRWHQLPDLRRRCDEVEARLRENGPQTAREMGGAKRTGQWWDWSEVKIAAEWLFDVGVVTCRERRGFERVYDLTERAVPADLRDQSLDDEACAAGLVESAARALGVATVADLAAYHGLKQARVRSVLASTSLTPVRVEGWAQGAFLAPGAEAGLRPGLRGRTTLLSPFDSLVWDRARFERLFGLAYRLEAYVPAPKRVVGYFAMPVLVNDRIVGLVDPKRVGTTLHARHVVVHDETALDHIARALVDAAAWVGADVVVIDRTTPGSLREALRAATR